MNARTKLGSAGLTAMLVAVVSSCGGGGGSPLTVDSFCTQKAEKECTVTVAACVSDLADCKTARKKICTDWAAQVVADDAERVFKGGNVSACISKAEGVYKQNTIKPSDLAALDDVCNYVFQGAVAKDHECKSKYDCVDNKLICDKTLCATKVTKGKDEPCADPGAVCSTGQWCTMAGALKKCVNKAGMGESCADGTPCLETLRCSAGKCAALVAAGEACTADSDCVTTHPFCDPFAGHLCAPGLKFATHSASCGPFGDDKAAEPVGGAGSTGTAGAGGAGGSAGAGGAGGSAGAGGAAGAAGAGGAAGATSSDAGSD